MRSQGPEARVAVVHFPFAPRGSTVSGQHSKLWYPRLYLVLLWSNPT